MYRRVHSHLTEPKAISFEGNTNKLIYKMYSHAKENILLWKVCSIPMPCAMVLNEIFLSLVIRVDNEFDVL